MSERLVDAVVYLQIEPRDRMWDSEEHAYVGEPRSAAVVRSTQNPPKDPAAGHVVTKVVVRVPVGLFMAPRAFAVVEVSEDTARQVPVQIHAEMPEED